MFHAFYQQSTDRICAPDDGFSGGGVGQCPDFANASTASTVI
ncbi:DUF6970 domain-containing protein [Nitrosomonas sp.]